MRPRFPPLIGGSADLNPSTNTALKGRGNFQSPLTKEEAVQGAEAGPWGYSGANVAFGVREHAMGSILNGIALHGGALPFGSTFLVFSDYMRPAIRLAALMKLQVVYVFTHDSIALGEDGPTHQPIEHLLSLRAIPGLTVIRPADANEAAEAWKAAVASPGRPHGHHLHPADPAGHRPQPLRVRRRAGPGRLHSRRLRPRATPRPF